MSKTGSMNSVKRNSVLTQKVCNCVCDCLVTLASRRKRCSFGNALEIEGCADDDTFFSTFFSLVTE